MSGARSLTVQERRRQLGRDALFTLAEAARLLPRDHVIEKSMLLASGRCRTMDGTKYVLWGDALDAWFEACDETQEAARPTVREDERPRRRRIR